MADASDHLSEPDGTVWLDLYDPTEADLAVVGEELGLHALAIEDAVQRRLALLSPPAQQVLTFAAVTGRRFDFALLQHLTRSEEAALLALDKKDGTVIWKGVIPGGDRAGYSSIVVAELS